MRLSQVIYNLFASDAEWLDAESDRDFHILDREILLVLDGLNNTYISWVQTLSDDDIIFAIAHKETSFFNETPIVRDMSAHPFWLPLIGADVKLNFIGSNHQVLEIRAPHHTVFCSVYEEGNWGIDVVYVSLVCPRNIG